MHSPEGEFPHIAADVLERLRQFRPRVHCITNAVAQAFTANMLLAVGAMPSMTLAPAGARHFCPGARPHAADRHASQSPGVRDHRRPARNA